jgi:hypothetical protein
MRGGMSRKEAVRAVRLERGGLELAIVRVPAASAMQEAAIWFQLGSNEGPKNRRFLGISGADSTVLKFVNILMLYH